MYSNTSLLFLKEIHKKTMKSTLYSHYIHHILIFIHSRPVEYSNYN